jgi:SAM-dependent methyltransferase
MPTRPYEELSVAIEESVERNGPTPAAVWLDRRDALRNGLRRCEAIFRMLEDAPDFSVLDLGCGPGLALPYLDERHGARMRDYLGVDISPALLDVARRQHPGRRFEERDIIAAPLPERSFDFVGINGVLTARYTLSHEAMEAFAREFLASAWASTGQALSFNVMSPFVDWTRDDLFHWPVEQALGFCIGHLSRHVNVIADYGLYEYTVQVFREPRPARGPLPRAWAPEAGA